MSDILKDGSYYKLYTQAKSTSACGLPKGFFEGLFLRSCDAATFVARVAISNHGMLVNLGPYFAYFLICHCSAWKVI